MESAPPDPLKKKLFVELPIAAANVLVAICLLGCDCFLEDSHRKETVKASTRYLTAAVLLVPAAKALYLLYRVVSERGLRKMNKLKVLCSVAYLSAITAVALLILVNPSRRFSFEEQAVTVSVGSLMGMVVSSTFLNHNALSKRNYIRPLMALACLALAAEVVAASPLVKSHKAPGIARWLCIATGLALPTLHSLLTTQGITDPISLEDSASFNVLAMLVLILSVAAVAHPVALPYIKRFIERSEDTPSTHFRPRAGSNIEITGMPTQTGSSLPSPQDPLQTVTENE